MDDQKKKFDFQSLQDLKFPGHEVFKNRLPKAMQLAEAVAEEWKKDGDFNGLPVGHPITQVALGLGLRKAKDIEKKLEQKGVFTMAQIGYEYAKVQAAKLPIEKLPLDRLPDSLAQFLKKNSTSTENAQSEGESESESEIEREEENSDASTAFTSEAEPVKTDDLNESENSASEESQVDESASEEAHQKTKPRGNSATKPKSHKKRN